MAKHFSATGPHLIESLGQQKIFFVPLYQNQWVASAI